MKLPMRFYSMLSKLLFPLFLCIATLKASPIFIGTNTGTNSASKGIYLTHFDSITGKLTEPVLAAEYQNPGFLALHPTKPLLYACGTPNTPFVDGSSAVAAFTISPNHHLKFLGESSTRGKGACHLAVDATGRTLAVANYSDGSFSTLRLADDGVLGATVSVIKPIGTGPNLARQDGPHAHGVYFDQANRHLFIPDLGLDQVFIYPFDAVTSKLGKPLPSLTTLPGAGPRHMAFSPDEKHAYVINELNNTILSTTSTNGKLTAFETVQTLPLEFNGESTTSEIEVHPSGSFVYASNRGHDSIVVFQRHPQTGSLTLRQHADCGGKTPRHFKIDPTGKWLLCAHQESNTISVLPLDPQTGNLGAPIHTVATPSPICLLFAR